MRSIHNVPGLMASILLAIFVSTPASAQQDTPPTGQAMMDLVIQVQQLQDEVRALTGRLEDQSAELENLRDRQRDQYLDLDQRITDLRSGPPGPVVAGPGTAGSTATTGGAITTAGAIESGQPAPGQSGDTPEVRAPLETQSSVTALATPDTQARAMVNLPEAEKAAYDQAFQSLKELKYAAAAEQFQVFLQQYPNSEFADNAQYWLGESYYVTRNYDIALEAFQGLLTSYPDSPKVADGLLKIGYTHYELKQWEQARAALEQVQEQYPGTTLARLAASRLRSMKLEGHY